MAETVEALERCLVEITTDLARENPITLESVQSKLHLHRLGGKEKQLLKTTLRVTTDYRKRGQFGRVRAAMLLGTTMFGTSFITKAERAGVLLCDEARSAKFHQLLEQPR